MTQVGEGDYRLLVTSNDAPDAFPILASRDLEQWRLTGFVFPRGAAPAWALTGLEVSDFWAPELHRVGGQWCVCFTARTHDGSLAIGLARSGSPDGPYAPDPEPLLTGGVIDAHILVDAGGQPWLVWKKDDNDVWPSRLAALLRRRIRGWLGACNRGGSDRAHRVALARPLAPGLVPGLATGRRCRRFFALQTSDRSGGRGPGTASIYILPECSVRSRVIPSPVWPARSWRRSAPASSSSGWRRTAVRRRGEPRMILQNDLTWEGHLIEGVWIAL